MARRTSSAGATIQPYPRIQDDIQQSDLLDDSTLLSHQQQMSLDDLKNLVRQAIANANLKSSRAILNIPDGADQAEIETIYRREGGNLLKYFRKYCGDPAATAHQVYKKTYQEVGVEQFRNRTLQKERMNSGWRYQFLATLYARALGQPEATIEFDEVDIGDDVDFSQILQTLYSVFGCEDVMRTMLDALMESGDTNQSVFAFELPNAVVEAFGEACRSSDLIDDSGRFHDPYRLVEFLCGQSVAG